MAHFCNFTVWKLKLEDRSFPSPLRGEHIICLLCPYNFIFNHWIDHNCLQLQLQVKGVCETVVWCCQNFNMEGNPETKVV